jgi:signal peptidase I
MKERQYSKTKRAVTEKWLRSFEENEKGWLIVTSMSMAPLIRSGNLVFIKKVSPSAINMGDIVTFWNDNNLIVHRIIVKVRKEKELCFIERADRFHQHSWVSSKHVLGKATKIKKGDQIYAIDTFLWKLRHRLIGLFFLFSLLTRKIYKKIFKNTIK